MDPHLEVRLCRVTVRKLMEGNYKGIDLDSEVGRATQSKVNLSLKIKGKMKEEFGQYF